MKKNLQENKKMTLKEMIKKELAEMLQEENINTESARGRNPAAYGGGGPDISGASSGFKGVRGTIDDKISEAFKLAKEVRELLPEDNPISAEKAGKHIEDAIQALLRASNVYRL
tara:strand:+ start:1159 stop:1500 length:342 start_codon:yes stop_codon:yes gene_type:complete